MNLRARAWVIRTAASLTIGVLAPCLAHAVDNAATRAIAAKTAGKAMLHRDVGGRVTHLRSAATPIAVDPTLSSDARARAVLKQYRDAFLDPSIQLDLTTTRAAPLDPAGRNYVRYQQRFNGIPVRGGNVLVHLDPRGVTAVHSKLHSDLGHVATTPGLDAAQAQAIAERSIGKLFPKSRLSFTTPRLEIVNPDQLRGMEGGESRLAWFTVAVAIAPSVREFAWIDAQRGDVLLHFSQVAHASAVSVLDYAGACLDAAPVVTPYDNTNLPHPSGSDVETGYNNLTAAYTFYENSYTWLGFDGTDAKSQAAIVRVCDAEPSFAASPEKAEWFNASGSPDQLGQMLFATGVVAAEDIVGHEYTHGVIEYSSGLNLLQQSGALAEGFADVFGETIDQLQNTANDTGDTKWAFGEDATGGPFRNLSQPGDNSLPGKVTDTNFYCGTDNSIWIHRNGAVISHAFVLLADGGTYNGFTVTGIGVPKAARIFFETVTARLADSSTFDDAYIGFKAAADALVASGDITSSDRAQLAKVLDAVELDVTPCATLLNYCPTAQTPAMLFNEGFENTSSGLWTNTVTTGVNHWSDSGNDGAGVGTPAIYFAADPSKGTDPSGALNNIGLLPARGTYALWGATERRTTVAGRLGDSNVAMVTGVTLPVASNARMQFEGRFAFESASEYAAPDGTVTNYGADGGVIEYSINGGAWQDASALIAGGQGYNGVIDSGQSNPLGGRSAFVGSSTNAGYSSTQLDLSGVSLSGQSIRFRFRIGTDNFDDSMGWQIDDVKIYTCTDVALVVSPTEGLITSEGGGTASFTVHLGRAPQGTVTLNIESGNTSEGTVSAAELVFDSANYDQDQTVTITGVDDGASDGDTAYTVTVSVNQTNDPAYQGAQPVPVTVTNTTASAATGSGKKGGGGVGMPLLLVMLLLAIAHAVGTQRSRWNI